MSVAPAKLASRTFAIAGIYGLIVLLPLYFAEPAIARRTVPLTHPEYFYGFLGAASVMQLVYLTIARDPVRFRPLMPLAVLAKLNFFIAVVVIYAIGRTSMPALGLVTIDLLIGIGFLIAWLRLRAAE